MCQPRGGYTNVFFAQGGIKKSSFYLQISHTSPNCPTVWEKNQINMSFLLDSFVGHFGPFSHLFERSQKRGSKSVKKWGPKWGLKRGPKIPPKIDPQNGGPNRPLQWGQKMGRKKWCGWLLEQNVWYKLNRVGWFFEAESPLTHIKIEGLTAMKPSKIGQKVMSSNPKILDAWVCISFKIS